ncbi:MAG: hypothetical protein MUF69_01445 [Desulfobacterota bacterium]|jgi:hypothetical protein|nr:hypothetical protein [Thermodesulfobacteriota bacterium]
MIRFIFCGNYYWYYFFYGTGPPPAGCFGFQKAVGGVNTTAFFMVGA